MTDQQIMKQAVARARETMLEGVGGPFGAAVVGPDGEVIAVASNSVLGDHDPTAHAEVNAIRQACRRLGTHDLRGCTIYATGYPCPMCLGAIIWANIRKVHYGCVPADAEKIGFRDDFIYRFIEGGRSDEAVLTLEECERETCLTLFDEYAAKNKTMY